MGVNVAENTFSFGLRNREALNVDATLANLFECLTVECRYSPSRSKRE